MKSAKDLVVAPLLDPSAAARLFPTLTPAQIARIAALGTKRSTTAGEVLIEPGARPAPFLVVLEGELQILRPSPDGDELIVTLGPGQFGGETNLMTGRPALIRARAGASGTVIQLDHDRLLALVQTDAELGQILLRAFILRRVELIARGYGDVIVIGSTHCAGTLRIKEFLVRNGHPHVYIDLDRESDAQELLDRFHVSSADIPVLICRGKDVLRNPSNQQIADCLGFNPTIDRSHVRDLVVVGAGPAGLAAAVYGASEGLDVLVLEADAPGGQAGTSSRIENYLGFPTGISGAELTGRAQAQALKFGAQILVARRAAQLVCDRQPYRVEIDAGAPVAARTVIIATGAEYRRPPIENLAQFEGAGVYYAATPMEAQLCADEEIVVVGGGNSAGQAAVFLAQTCRRVHMLVRGDGLAQTMSRYLIRRIEDSPTITLHTRTEVVALEGNGHLAEVHWSSGGSGTPERHEIRHVFMMTGAVPNTRWVKGCLVMDEKGFIKTGADLSREDLVEAQWPLARAPYLLETSRPGVFAVGDVRGGNIKRVASAVGEGSIAVAFVHQVLSQ